MAQHDPYIDKQIGNYRIEQMIASGAFGTVYLASHLYLKQRTVVIKMLHALHLGSDEEKEQFLQEAQILETLKGLANILPLLDVGIDGNVPYMIAEYAEQGSLRARMRQRGLPLPLQEALTIIEQVGRGLQNAHNQGIVHRDLKPENILFNAKGEALLADFGISTVLSTSSVRHTQVIGTPAYMAPEQFLGEVCKENDQYALACIAYELLTGHKLFEAPDLVSMGFLHATRAPTPPRQFNPQIPESVEHAVLRALSKDRTERYPSVSGFVAALKNVDNNKDRGMLPLAQRQLTSPTLPSTQPAARNPSVLASPISYNTTMPAPAGPSAPTQAFYPAETRVIVHDPTAEASPPMHNISPPSTGWSPPGGNMSPHRMPPPKRNGPAIIIVALVILTLLVIGGGAAILLSPNMFRSTGASSPATITITPTSKTVQDNYTMQGVTSNANPANRQVTVRQLTSTKTATDTVNTTGHTQTAAAAAAGTLTFTNGSLAPFNVASGTQFSTPNGVVVVNDKDVTIPAASPGTVGRMTVNAHALNQGVAGNITPLAIDQPCCNPTGEIRVQNQNAFTGGQDDQDYHFLQQKDVDGVTNAHQTRLKSDAQNDIKGQTKPGEQLLADIDCNDPKTTADVTPGDQGPGKNVTTAHVTVSVSCSAQVFDANATQSIAENALKQKAMQDPGTGYVLAGRIITQVQSSRTQQDGSVTFQVSAKGIWYYQWTDTMKQDLLNQIKGKSATQAQTILNGNPGVGKAKIDLSNGGNTLSRDVTQITLDIKQVNGL